MAAQTSGSFWNLWLKLQGMDLRDAMSLDKRKQNMDLQ